MIVLVWASPEAGLAARALGQVVHLEGDPQKMGRGLRKVRQGGKAVSKGGLPRELWPGAAQCSVFLGTSGGHIYQSQPSRG